MYINTKPNPALFAMILCLFLGMFTNTLIGQAAFPGAEGFGANSVGGRGNKVIKVSNLNDQGPGSFREAVTTFGRRIIVFDVSGIINLSSNIIISNPYLTIAGQTSPGGILITGRRFIVNTNNVIIRYMSFRVGSHGGLDPEKNRSFEIYGNGKYYPNPAFNIIVDHCSFSWGADQTVSVGEDAYDVTISWSILAEGLNDAGHPENEHSYAILYWGKYTNLSRNYSFHHNYVVHNGGRTPEINYNGTLDAVNNVIYNYIGGKSPCTGGNAKANWIYNYIKPGKDSNPPNSHFEARHNLGGTVAPNIYTFGNIGVQRTDQSDPTQWYIGQSWTSTLLPETWRSNTEVVPSPVTETVMTYTYAQEILKTVGSSIPVRDRVDSRLVADFVANTGRIIDNVSYPDDFPTFLDPPAPADNDNDGMPDTWETTYGLNPNDPSDCNGTDLSMEAYTNIEMYINELADSSITVAPVGQDLVKEQQCSMLMSYPNPFTPSTTIKYSIANRCFAQIRIYNHLGQEIYVLLNEQKTAGEYNVSWDGKDTDGNSLPSGIYYCHLTAGKQSFSHKMKLKK